MKKAILVSVTLAIVIVGWTVLSNPQLFSQGSDAVAKEQSTGVGPLPASQADKRSAERSPVERTSGKPSDQQVPSLASETVSDEEMLEYISECRPLVGRDPLYSRFVDGVPSCIPDDRMVARYNEMHVLPYHPVVLDNCKLYYSSDEDLTPARECKQRPRDIYPGASKSELQAWMAAGDATAASLLVDFPESTPQDRFDAALEAYRLSGKPAELIRYVELYSEDRMMVFDPQTREVVVDRFPSAIHALNAYVLSRIAKNGGDPRAKPELWLGRFTDHASGLSPDQFDQNATRKAVEALVASRLDWRCRMRRRTCKLASMLLVGLVTSGVAFGEGLVCGGCRTIEDAARVGSGYLWDGSYGFAGVLPTAQSLNEVLLVNPTLGLSFHVQLSVGLGSVTLGRLGPIPYPTTFTRNVRVLASTGNDLEAEYTLQQLALNASLWPLALHAGYSTAIATYTESGGWRMSHTPFTEFTFFEGAFGSNLSFERHYNYQPNTITTITACSTANCGLPARPQAPGGSLSVPVPSEEPKKQER